MISTVSPKIQLEKYKKQIVELCTYIQDEQDKKLLQSYALQIDDLLHDKSASYDKLSLYCIVFSKTIYFYLSKN